MSENRCRETEEVLKHHLDAFSRGDVDAVMEDYADNAIVIDPMGVYAGTAEIRKMSERNLASIIPPGSDFELTKRVVTERVAYIHWKAESKAVKIPFGSDSFFIENGKIVAQTIAATPIIKENVQH